MNNPEINCCSNNFIGTHSVRCTMIKLKTVLTKLISPNFKPSDDTVLPKLFDHLCSSSKNGNQCHQQVMKIVVPWLNFCITQWDTINEEVKGFILKVVSCIVSEPEGFNVINEENVLLFVDSYVRENVETQKNSTILGYVDIVHNLINHELGRQWVIDKGSWKLSVQFCLKNQSIYVKRRSQQLLSHLILSVSNNSSLIDSIITEALQYETRENLINLYEIKNPTVLGSTNVTQCYSTLKDMKLNCYKLILEILTASYSSESANALQLFEVHRIQDLAWTNIHIEEDVDIILSASKFLCIWNLSSINCKANEENLNTEAHFSLLISKHLNLLIVRHLFPKILLETCVEYSSLWHKYVGKLTREDGDFTKVENLLFLVQAIPMFICAHQNLLEKNEITELFLDKIFKAACPNAIRLCYFYRDQIRLSQSSLPDFTCQVINSFIRVSLFCEKEQAVMVFQGLMHLLKKIVHSGTSNDSQNSNTSAENLITSCPNLLAVLLNGLTCYLKKFKFSWRDSLETVCMLSFIQSLITNPDVPFMVCAEALKLAKLVLLHFLPPNLALLVDTLQGSSMRDLGNQLFKTLGSMHWEVRDSTLEVLQVIGCLAQDKFPAFQSIFLENDLPKVILSIVESDCEAYVRASALSCLSELVKIQITWDNYLQKEKNLNCFVSLLYFETEGIVRSQAVLLIRDIYKYRTLSDNNLDKVYDALYHVTLNDLHWEVKISALEFWDAVTEQCFTSIGMTDGSFPEVIFSKEKKKIIQLTPNEVLTRVKSALNHLSLNGCLKSLWETMNDDCDTQVRKKSVIAVQKLVNLISPFNIIDNIDDIDIKGNKNEMNYVDSNTQSDQDLLTPENIKVMNKEVISYEHGPSHELIIDEIVAENDLRLLSGLIQLTEPIRVYPEINRIAISPSDFFIKLKSIDLNNYFTEKPQFHKNHFWDMESLLDDILLFSKNGEDKFNKNNIDCY